MLLQKTPTQQPSRYLMKLEFLGDQEQDGVGFKKHWKSYQTNSYTSIKDKTQVGSFTTGENLYENEL